MILFLIKTVPPALDISAPAAEENNPSCYKKGHKSLNTVIFLQYVIYSGLVSILRDCTKQNSTAGCIRVQGKEFSLHFALLVNQGQQIVVPSARGYASCTSDNAVWHYLIFSTYHGQNKCSGNIIRQRWTKYDPRQTQSSSDGHIINSCRTFNIIYPYSFRYIFTLRFITLSGVVGI